MSDEAADHHPRLCADQKLSAPVTVAYHSESYGLENFTLTGVNARART